MNNFGQQTQKKTMTRIQTKKKMVPRLLLFSETATEKLVKEAAKRGLSVSEMVRKIIDQHYEKRVRH